MAKSSFEKALEKQQREQKSLAEKQLRESKKRMEEAARREHASSIVNGRPLIGNMRIMDASSEQVLRIILSLYDNNEECLVRGNYEKFSEQQQHSLALEFEKLSMYGMITINLHISIIGTWEVFLTPQGISYFKDKEMALENNKKDVKLIANLKQYDVFISHANKDKSDYVDLLYTTLRKLGINIFYDSEVLSWGDNWKKVLIDGTESSEFAIIVISENFFDREWTERELKEFLQRQNSSGQKIILPLLHNITLEQLKEKYPELGDIQAIDTERYSKEDIAILFAKELLKRYKCS